MKKLTRSKDNKMIAGVLGGLGEYLNIDPTALRLAYLLVTALTGFIPGVVVYLAAILVVPNA